MVETLLSLGYTFIQVFYLLTFLVMLYFLTRSVNWVVTSKAKEVPEWEYPFIILFYPVLNEPLAAMETAMEGLAKIRYPKGRYRIIAIPNSNDSLTVGYLRELAQRFDFLDILEVPPTTDPSWDVVWSQWEANGKVYWWHQGAYARDTALPPKKTRQLIYAFYTMVQRMGGDFLVDYIDADSVPPEDHFEAAVAGISVQGYDVLQATNIAGNLLQTWAATFHALDHLVWDRFIYPHMSSNGTHPFWVLGKGLFYKASDLVAVGGFNPQITIEDPEIGMKLWANGKKIGIINNPLIEEVPIDFGRGVTQRKRWICGFFQAVEATKHMGMSTKGRLLSHLNLIPVLSLIGNALGLPLGIWALLGYFNGTNDFTDAVVVISLVNITSYLLLLVIIYRGIWRSISMVLKGTDKVRYMLRINPVFMWLYWLWWIVSIVIGYRMYRKDLGRVWERTLKIDANRQLVHEKLGLVEVPRQSDMETEGTQKAAASGD